MVRYEYDKVCIDTFLKKQLQLFPETVAETPEEAEEFLEDCMAVVWICVWQLCVTRSKM